MNTEQTVPFIANQKVKVHLNNSTSYTIDLIDHPFVHRWVKALDEILTKKLVLEKNFCFLGFADSKRDLKHLCNELNITIETINSFNATQQWQNNGLEGYNINKQYVPADFQESADLPIGEGPDLDHKHITPGLRLKHDACNELHRYFEDLQGEVWGISSYYKLADDKTKYAIRQLNNLCHEIEGWVNAYRKINFEPEWQRPAQITTFLNAPRHELQEKDYDLFLENRYDREFGGVYQHWCQIGKTHYEVYRDEDGEKIDDVVCSAISGLKYYSGEFDVEWGQTVIDTEKYKWHQQEMQRFEAWCKENGIDWEDPKNSLGYIKIGQINLKESFGTENFLDIIKLLTDNLDITKIELVGPISNNLEFNYNLNNDHWKQIQMEALKGSYRKA